MGDNLFEYKNNHQHLKASFLGSDLTEIGSNIEFQKSKFLNQNYNQN